MHPKDVLFADSRFFMVVFFASCDEITSMQERNGFISGKKLLMTLILIFRIPQHGKKVASFQN